MLIKQISAFIENKSGRLAEVTRHLADENINIHAMSMADTTDFGILRLIVDNPDEAVAVLRKNNLMVKTTGVIAVALDHQPGSLARVLSELERVNVSIEYIYAFTSRSMKYDAIVILSLSKQDEAIEKIKNCNIKILQSEELEHLNGK